MKNSKTKKWIKKLKQNLYKWHRTLGIITIVPVIFWCLSGLMHPVMAHWFKPSIAHEKLQAAAIDTSLIKLSIHDVLTSNKVERFHNFRLVHFNNSIYYQVKTIKEHEVLYFNASNGSELVNGDIIYAEWLSRYFIDDQKSTVATLKLQTEFDGQYKYVNRYLPVWKLTFNRANDMDVYVETTSSKLATYNPTSRKIQLWVFDTFHNWNFLESITNKTIQITVMILLLSIIGFSALSGIVIYGFFWKVFKKAPVTDNQSRFRKHHRKIGIAVSLVTLTFTFSGGYHATKKLDPYTLDKMIYTTDFKTSDLSTLDEVVKPGSNWSNYSVVQLDGIIYLQVSLLPNDDDEVLTKYINCQTGIEDKAVENKYIVFLANKFAKLKAVGHAETPADCCDMANLKSCIAGAQLVDTKILYQFDNREYGFVNKRLPVIKLSYNTEDHTAIYIDPSTSRLAAFVTDSDRIEGYSFAILHKFLFMDWAGKNIRDLVMSLAALGVLAVSLMGLYLFLKRK
ncbi:PepSY domain-containing protein [Flavobacterium algicola]|uniref:PepSY domain-containing protein n=1 Tax=Flavobacterium algicola TaxID=556529 RepID=UPI001EFC4721|nr:PepSY domain-containing protein [Flavobacterium algicola]MCG9793306.1 PepSY domain-containing protein [Flavobacterium algicola]